MGSPARDTVRCGVKTEDFFPQIVVEPAHDADDDDEHRHAQGDADDGDERDDGNKGPFGPQITQGQQEFKRQFRHGAQAKGASVRVSMKGATRCTQDAPALTGRRYRSGRRKRIAFGQCRISSRQKKLADQQINPAQRHVHERRENRTEPDPERQNRKARWPRSTATRPAARARPPVSNCRENPNRGSPKSR